MVALLVCFCDSRQRSLDLDFLALVLGFPFSLLGLLARGKSLGIPDQCLDLLLGLTRAVAHQQLVVPSRFAVRVVDANVAGRREPLLRLALPLTVCRCVLFVVKVSGKGKGQTLVQPALVQEECLFERVQWAGQDWCAGNHNAGS